MGAEEKPLLRKATVPIVPRRWEGEARGACSVPSTCRPCLARVAGDNQRFGGPSENKGGNHGI